MNVPLNSVRFASLCRHDRWVTVDLDGYCRRARVRVQSACFIYASPKTSVVFALRQKQPVTLGRGCFSMVVVIENWINSL